MPPRAQSPLQLRPYRGHRSEESPQQRKRLVNYLAFGPREPEDVRLISGLDGGGEGLPVMRQQFLDPVYRMRRDAR
jgi:hypothetical protein